MENRAEIIKGWIDTRKEDNEIAKCVFYITVPKIEDLVKNETIKKVEAILDSNLVGYSYVDSVDGSWDLNREWIETEEMDCIIEFCGVYPVDWNIEDVVEFEQMETDGELVILVDKIEDGKCVPNH